MNKNLGFLAWVFSAAVCFLKAEEARAWEAKAVELQEFLMKRVNESPDRTVVYWQKLAELGKLVSADTADSLRRLESPGIYEVLAVIAGDCTNKPDALEELRAWYIPSAYLVTEETRQQTYERMKQLGYAEHQLVPLKFVKWIRPKGAPDGDEYDLFVIHCRPEYRSAWEAFYLQPTLRKMRQAQQALEDYADERSVVVMEQAFLGLAAIRFPGECHPSKETLTGELLTNLCRAGNVRSVRALLACLDAYAEDPFAPVTPRPLPLLVGAALTARIPPHVTSNFATRRNEPINFVPMMEEVLKDPTLPQRHREFLSNVLKNTPANKQK